MASKVYIIRHAEATHNVAKDFSIPDPPLTALGLTQAASLVTAFPNPSSIAVVLVSPLTRTIQTALAGFSHVLDTRYYSSGGGVESGVDLILDPQLQERSAHPCDTGSTIEALKVKFPSVKIDGVLESDWFVKTGSNSADDDAVEKRAADVRRRLGELVRELTGRVSEGPEGGAERKDVVVVTHGVFMKFLSGDAAIDLPKAGWSAYEAVEEGQGQWKLVEAG